MDVTRAALEALATKLRPHVQGLSDDELALLNYAFDRALPDDDNGSEVEGYGLNFGWFGAQISPPIRSTTGGGGTSTPPTTTGGTKKSASFDPASVKFPGKPA